MAKIVLFSTNNFTVTSGGTIRMQGVLNALAQNGNEVIFISNCKNYNGFHAKIQHINLDYETSKQFKRLFQLSIAFFPVFIVNLLFSKFLTRIQKTLSIYQNSNIIFFEYLDNSIAYWLFKNHIINAYVNDIHGIAAEEFKFQIQKSDSLKKTLALKLKLKTSQLLDKKVIESAYKIIVPTKAMLDYWGEKFPKILSKKNLIIPNIIENFKDRENIEPQIISKFKNKIGISNDKVILFAGGFKKSSGVLTLIKAFNKIHKKHSNYKLLLLGDGPLFNEAETLISEFNLKEKILLLGFTKYENLPIYQEIADILICPDDDNIFSHLIIHFKYLDALMANKVVINGNFRSVLEINPNEKLSVGFEPSNVDDLSQTISKVIQNYDLYKSKYNSTKSFVLENMSYQNHINKLENL